MKSEAFLGKKIVCEDLDVGRVKGLIVDSTLWKISHLEVELTKDAAEKVLGVRLGGIRNSLSVSAINEVDKTINLKVAKGQLRVYLMPLKRH